MSAKLISQNIFFYVLFEVVNKAMPFLLVPVLTHYLSPQDMGVVAEFTAILGILSIIVGLNVYGAVNVAFFKLAKNELAIYIYNVLLILIVTCGVALTISFFLEIAGFSITGLSFKWFQVAIFVATMSFFTTVNLVLWQSEMKSIAYGIYQTLLTVLNVSLSLLFVVVIELGWEGRVLGQSISVIILGIYSIYILYKRGYIKRIYHQGYLKNALNFGLPLVPHSLSLWVFMGFNIILISSQFGQEEAGIFSVALQFAMILAVVNSSINRALQPVVFKYLSNITAEGKVLYVKYIYGGMIGLCLLGVIFYFASIFLFDLFIAPEFNQAREFIPYLIVAEIFNGMYFLVVKPIYYVNKNYRISLSTFIAAIIHVVLSPILILQVGVLGVVYSLIIATLFMFLMVWVQSQAVFPLPWLNFHAAP